jgi:RimJ/RimL family protein N-acetyltransferase
MDTTTRPIGPIVDFDGAKFPDGRTLVGAHVRLEKIDPARHGAALWAQMAGQDALWDYLYEEPPVDEAEFLAVVTQYANRADWLGYAVCLPDGAIVGYAYYLNIVPAMGTIEVGNINFAPVLQKTIAATEAMVLMMREAFALGYRRYEWKCNALNQPSRRAAQRLGFSWEGIFRQHLIVKTRNRDTAWLAMCDDDWPAMDRAFEIWLAPDNFDDAGRQRRSLSTLTGPHRVASDPDQAG